MDIMYVINSTYGNSLKQQLCNKKLSWCWQTRATHLEVSQGHQT